MKKRELAFVVVTVLVLSCLTLAGKQDDLYNQYQTFSRLVATISENYVEKVDTKKLFYGAYEGMLQTLDPYSAFLPPEEKEELEVETKGEFGGLGIEITLDKSGVLTVISPLEDSPAFKAGVMAGDRIIKIEGKSTKGISLRDAVRQLRGPKGSPVKITVFHENEKLEDVTVIRDLIKLESVKDALMVDEKHKIGYLRMTQFQANTLESLDKAVKDLRAKGMKALVLDLRYNPGGLLTSAIEVSDRFLSKGVIVSTKGRRSRDQVFEASKEGTYPDLPLAILISGRTASAAEIVSGAVQDNKRGILVGTRTFGKGSVQTLLRLEDGQSGVRLTTAHYYTPSGRLIHRNPNNPDQKTWGIDPDIEVKTTLQDEVDLWNHWRDEHLRKVREPNHKDTTPKEPDKDKAPPKKDSEPDKDKVPPKKDSEPDKENVPPKKDLELPPPDEIGPPDNMPVEKDKAPKEAKEFHDRTLKAAIDALTGMLLAQERAELPVPAAAK